MCGIVGYLGHREALQIIISGLEKLEYRGYDSAGVAVISQGSSTPTVFTARAMGKLSELKKVLAERADYPKAVPSKLQVGIGHTRWATHGKPSETNAHPHTAGRVSLIHNGIVENYLELRAELEKQGSIFKSETDTEIAAHLLNSMLETKKAPFEALQATCARIRGSYAFVAIDAMHPDRLLVAKNSTPIIIGLGEGELVVASDIPAVLPVTRKIMILEDGDIAEVSLTGIRIENNGKAVTREPQIVSWDPVTAQKGGFKHFMLKEVHEQGRVLADTFRGRVELESPDVLLPELGLPIDAAKSFNRVVLLGCGTAWHACLVAKFYIESLTGIPCEVDYSSEFRYREALFDKDTLVLAISQSGETADTLGAIDLVKNKGNADPRFGSYTLAICNVVGSSLSRRARSVLYTHAGPEISVASTKAFTTQLVAALLLALHIGKRRNAIADNRMRDILSALLQIPGALDEALKSEAQVTAVAKEYHTARDFLFLGRGICYPIALEGALKLKEISYIHAEGYPSGEMKHGPIALIDENMPVVMVLQRSHQILEKAISNMKEVEARGGRIIVITDALGEGGKKREELGISASAHVVEVPFLHDFLSPLLLTIPLQLLAYHVAVQNGTDVDLPRNLAKSVTVE